MKQEPNSWAQYMDAPTIAKNIKLNLQQFNKNYVESTRVAKDKSKKKEPHWADKATPELMFYAMMIQPPPLNLEVQEGLLENLDDPQMSKKIAKNVIGTMINHKNGELKKNYHANLIQLSQSHKDDPAIKNNMTWIQEAIQTYYIMGGK